MGASEAMVAKRVRTGLWLGLGAGALAIAAAAYLFLRPKADADPYRTAAVDRGEVTRVVSATGGLQPVVSVQVGSTVSGPVKTVEVDFNDSVTAGQVLARIDPTTFQARVDQLAAQEKQVVADLAVAEADFARFQRLGKEGFASEQLLNQQTAALARARAAVQQVRAQLSSAQTDLSRTIIRAPVTGVVVDRRVDPGQPVAASFQAATLFVIAQDLSRLQAAISVDEADIGDVREGLPVRFTVDAFADETFEGQVAQVRKQGASAQGVVSYTVIVAAPNPNGRLLPGMTANAEIVVESRDGVVRAPNAALRFRPADPKIAAKAEALRSEGGNQGQPRGAGEPRPDGQGGGSGGPGGRLAEAIGLNADQAAAFRAAFQSARESAGPAPGPEAEQGARRAFMRKTMDTAIRAIEPTLTPEQKEKLAAFRAERAGRQGGGRTRPAVLWVLRDGAPEPVSVRLGLAADSFTEVADGLAEGDQVIIGGGPKPKRDALPTPPAPGGGGPGGVRIRGA